jgi:hypothetical protein
MKKIILLPLFALLALGTQAQDSTSLNQQFNTCDSVLDISGTYNHYPDGWSCYSVLGQQDWRCEAAYGVGNSPCFHINGYQAGAANNDENWLLTPTLNLNSYPLAVYLNFAATYYYAGDSLHIMVSKDYQGGNPDSSIYTWVELLHYGVMLYDTFYEETGVYDEFQCDLTPYKTTPITIGFKYVSDSVNASVWDLDSVTTSTVNLGPIPGTSGVANVTKQDLALMVIGMSTSSQVRFAFQAPVGQYNLAIYDLIGRKVYSQKVIGNGDNQVLTIDNANLSTGMYIMKVGNDNYSGVTKFGVL